MNLSEAPSVEANKMTRETDQESQIQQAIATLEADIVFGHLLPREHLIEDSLRERFGMKRHTVRQILLELEKMGLVERKKNIGALVKSYTINEVLELYNVREILETNCVRQISMPVLPEKLEAIIAIQRQHDEAVANMDPHVAFRVNIAFHKALFALSNNSILTEFITDAAQRAHVVRSLTLTNPDYLEKARKDHWDMIDALKRQDVEALVVLCRKHLQPSSNAYIERYRLR